MLWYFSAIFLSIAIARFFGKYVFGAVIIGWLAWTLLMVVAPWLMILQGIVITGTWYVFRPPFKERRKAWVGRTDTFPEKSRRTVYIALYTVLGILAFMTILATVF